MFKTTRHQGDSGVAAALAYYTSEGIPVSLPFGDAQRYDLIRDLDGKLERVQCKTAFSKNKAGNYESELRTLGGNQSWSGKVCHIDSNEVEYVVILCGDGSLWEFPSKLLHGRRSVTMCSKYEKYQVR